MFAASAAVSVVFQLAVILFKLKEKNTELPETPTK